MSDNTPSEASVSYLPGQLESLRDLAKREDAFTQNATGAKKHTAGKTSAHFVPHSFVVGLSNHMAIGAIKYGHGNYGQGMRESQCIDAAEAHLAALRRGEWIDPETGSPHWHAVAANAMMALVCNERDTLTRDALEIYIDGLTTPVPLPPDHPALARTPFYKK